MDKNTYNLSEEEYHLQEPETEAKRFASNLDDSVKSTSLFEKINRQHIIGGIIFIFLLFGGYQIIKGFWHVLSHKKTIVEKLQHPIQPTPAPTPPVETSTMNAVTKNQLDALTQTQHELQSSIQSLDMQLTNIQNNLTDLSNQLGQVNEELGSLQTNQEKLMLTQEKIKRVAEVKKEAPKPIYYVRAMIPGRVWMTTPDGSTLTLGLGDKLAGYGVIDAINPEQGIVTLSSGAVIGYSPTDR